MVSLPATLPQDAAQLRRRQTRLRRACLAGTILTAVAGAALVAWPKPAGYAAAARLPLVIATLALASGAPPLLLGLLGAWRAAALRARLAEAPAALRETALFLQGEQALAWRGIVAILGAGLVSGSLWVLAHWPQASALAPLQSVFAGLALGAIPLIGVLLVRRRRHLINIAYLRWCLAEQARHAARQGVTLTRRRPRRRGASAHETFLAGGFVWQLDDGFKNMLVTGQPGSGKTACALNALLDGFLASTRHGPLPIAGLVLDVKGDFRGKLERLCARHGRAQDLVVLDPAAWSDPARIAERVTWNPLDSDDDELEIATRLVAVLKMLGLRSQDTFFLDAAKTLIRHAIALLRAGTTGGPPSLPDIRRLIVDAARPEPGPFYDQCCGVIFQRYPAVSRMPAAAQAAIGYLESEFRTMPDRQQAGVIGTVTQLLDELEVEPIRSMITGRSTIRLGEALDRGKLFYADMPLAQRPRLALIVTTLIKLDLQNEVLRRVDKARPSFLLVDEFQSFFTAGEGRGDADFAQLSRQSRHANVFATQNIAALYRRAPNRDEVTNFLGNCAVKIFLRNTEHETDEWASRLFGEVSMISVVPSEAAALDGTFRRNRTTYSRQARMVRAVPPETFTRLAIPVRGERRPVASSVVHLASRGETQRLDLDWPVHPL